MKNWRVELISGGKIIAELEIPRGIFQGNALSLLLFVNAMMQLNPIFRKCTGVYKLTKSLEKISYLMYMDDIKLFTKKSKRIENSNTGLEIYSQVIGMEFD